MKNIEGSNEIEESKAEIEEENKGEEIKGEFIVDIARLRERIVKN